MTNNVSASVSAQINLPLPLGTVIQYMGAQATLPDLASLGWLVCDGSSISSATYPDLYAAIGTTYGGNGSPSFNLPNLLGCFMRSVDPNGTEDPDYSSRSSPIINNPTTVGPMVGSRQGCEVQNHQHNWSNNFGQITYSGDDINVQLCDNSPHGGNQGTQATTNNDGGGSETRPVNVYAYFLMFTGLPQTNNS